MALPKPKKKRVDSGIVNTHHDQLKGRVVLRAHDGNPFMAQPQNNYSIKITDVESMTILFDSTVTTTGFKITSQGAGRLSVSFPVSNVPPPSVSGFFRLSGGGTGVLTDGILGITLSDNSGVSLAQVPIISVSAATDATSNITTVTVGIQVGGTNFLIGQYVIIAFTDPSAISTTIYNGTFIINGITSTATLNQFTYTMIIPNPPATLPSLPPFPVGASGTAQLQTDQLVQQDVPVDYISDQGAP